MATDRVTDVTDVSPIRFRKESVLVAHHSLHLLSSPLLTRNLCVSLADVMRHSLPLPFAALTLEIWIESIRPCSRLGLPQTQSRLSHVSWVLVGA